MSKFLNAEYPSHLSKEISLEDGSALLLRPIKKQDASLLVDLFNSFSDQTIYLRFFTKKKIMTLLEARIYATVDYNRSFALVAIPLNLDEEKIVAVVRYSKVFSEKVAEFAVVVTDAWQFRGLGTIMLEYLVEIARLNGVEKIIGETLILNEPIKELLKVSGYKIKKYEKDDLLYFEFEV